MNNNVSIGNQIYLIGIEDRRTHLFENLWPLPHGVSYNSYAIVDDKCALLDTVQYGSEGAYIERIESLLDGRQLDYRIINHMEPDHSGEIEAVLRRWPSVKIVGNPQTRKVLAHYYEVTEESFLQVADGDTLELGHHTLKFVFTPWVHWPETMMTYEITEQVLFSGDAFGTFGTTDGVAIDGDGLLCHYESEMRRYYANIVGKYCGMVQKALKKLDGVPVSTIASLHGPVWRDEAADVVALYDKWSRTEADDAVVIIYGTMYNNTARMADYIAGQLAEKGVHDIKVYDSSKTDLSYLVSEIWRCKYVIMGSCSYNGGMFPHMDYLCTSMINVCLKDRSLAIFGSGSWAGGGVRALKEFSEKSGWNQVCEPVEIFGRMTPEKLAGLDCIAQSIAEDIKKNK